jgi:ribosomal-protein-alanine N-acetyltransferase
VDAPLPALSLRPATPDDFPSILKIERASHPAPWTETNFRAEMDKPYSRFLVLTDDETDELVAGYVVFWQLFDECQVLNVSVAPELRRRGLARQMLRRAISLATTGGSKRVTLDVRKSNQAAIQLYQALGFSIVHLRKGFYSDGEDAYQMSLSLTEEVVEF